MKMQTTTKNELLDRVTKRLIEDGRKTASSSELKSDANKMLKDVWSFNQAVGIENERITSKAKSR